MVPIFIKSYREKTGRQLRKYNISLHSTQLRRGNCSHEHAELDSAEVLKDDV